MEVKEQVLADLKTLGGVIEEFKTKSGADVTDLKNRVLGIEQHISKPSFFVGNGNEGKSTGSLVTDSEAYKDFTSRGMKATGKIQVGSFHKTAIINATGQNQPLVPAYRVPGIMAPGQQRLTVRDLLTVLPTNSNSVEFCKETSSTNAAAMQGYGSSPQAYENVAKAESALGFTLEHEPVQTLAHWFPISRQVLDDSGALQGYVNGRGMYFLKLKEETELLSGAGSGASRLDYSGDRI
jgi:HK97 family phage major capsid protein